jgi:hypothetical protein
MDRTEITALAEGMVPFVRECVAEATAVPPELAEQIASAVRMLHESPTIEREAPRPPKVTRIERDEDGNFVPVYDDRPV